jgi:hypothetical protein
VARPPSVDRHERPVCTISVTAAIDFQAGHDWDAVRSRCHELAVRAARELTDLGMEPLATGDQEYVQMLAVHLPPCDAGELGLRLYRKHRIEVLAQD